MRSNTRPKKNIVCLVLVFLCVSASQRLTTPAQVRPIYDRGATGLGQMLKRLNTTATALMIGAHPDDEDTALLTYLARGESARTAYLSLTRGDGGQNIIGPELGEALGVIRTEELLQARRLDGAEQYFTRAYDYGFSKTLDEAKSKWDEKVILCDVVRVIRIFQPLVVISQFTGTSADGHGQHQFSGYITPLAVKAAADASQCIEAGPAWTVKKFYVRHGFRATGEPQLKINTGKYDPLLGRSYFEIAMEARSQHKSQEQGVLELRGDQFSGLNTSTSGLKETGIFEGLDISGHSGFDINTPERTLFQLVEAYAVLGNGNAESLRNNAPTLTPVFKAYCGAWAKNDEAALRKIYSQDTIRRLESQMKEENVKTLIKYLEGSDRVSGRPCEVVNEKVVGNAAEARIYSDKYPSGITVVFVKEDGEWKITNRSPAFETGPKALANFERKELIDAIVLASGVGIDALSDAEMVVPGETIFLGVKAFTPLSDIVKIKGFRAVAPSGWIVTKAETPKVNSAAFVARETANKSEFFNVTVPSDLEITKPYWLTEPSDGGLFRWPMDTSSHTLPFRLPELKVAITIEVNQTEVVIERPVEYRYADDIRGEIRRNVEFVPKVTVEMDQSLLIVPYSEQSQTRQVVMTVTNHSQKPVTGTASLNFNTPVEWKNTASSQTFELKRTGEKTAMTFDVTIPARTKQGSYQITGQAMVGDVVANMTMKTITYPHIQTHRYYRPATVDVKVIDLKAARSKVGYIVGSGDRVSDAISQMGFDVEIVSERELASGNLSRFDVIVVGIRAYQVRPDLVANNQRLLDYARNGGTVIVQYQLPGFAQQNLMPYPAQMGPRVADENAKVTILQREHSIFNFPNKITNADFAAWVQERNLYNFSTMDAAYTPLLESHDAGEQENKGGLVIAKVGKGNWVYCSYSFFRQLPAGVPGAYRLFANLLSTRKPARK